MKRAPAAPSSIYKLDRDEIFVFGSNLAGRHGAGAAQTARVLFGAEPGHGKGPTGRCYALPTKDAALRSLPLDRIEREVADFLRHAEDNPEKTFLVTPVGCGLAGYLPADIAPFFATAPLNVRFPSLFIHVLNS